MKANVVAALLIGGAITLYVFPPAQYGFYPRCPLYSFAHLRCPGCGGTRAAAALLHGNFAEAFRYNALVFIMLPMVIGYLVRAYWSMMRRGPQHSIPVPVASCMVAAAAVFGVLRNFSGF